jgi:hypothetical protein
MFHFWLNIVAELLRFGDRRFYLDWWNACSLGVSRSMSHAHGHTSDAVLLAHVESACSLLARAARVRADTRK